MNRILAFLIIFVFSSLLYSQPYFQKITSGIIANDSGSYTMSAWADYDADGYLDLVVIPWNDGCWNCRTPIRFYKNNGDMTFSRGSSILVDHVLSCNGIAWGDYDNDGKIDLVITRYLNQTNLLFHNEGNGDFSFVTGDPVVTEAMNGAGVAWSDYDRDGWLDLFVARGLNQNNSLFHNNGNGTFTKVTSGIVVNDGGNSRGCAWGDYDNDSWPDLYVSNYGVQKNFFYHNNGNGTFTKITSGPPVDSAGYGSDCTWADYDNDGWLDLFVTQEAAFNRLYHNNHNGTFTLTNYAPSQEWGWSTYPAWDDIDNDGWIDLFVPKRTVNGYTGINALYRNLNGTSFAKLTSDVVGMEGGASDAGTFADVDNNGKVDLFVANGSAGNTKNYFYKNVTANPGNYITIKIRGCNLNRSAIGSRVRVVTGTLKQMREVSGGNGAQSMLWQHFGVGTANTIDSIIVTFTTGTVKRLANVPVNQIIDVSDLDCPLGIISNEIPLKYSLEQNFPNPFNPVTKIKYSILYKGQVTLSVYDLLGKLVRTIVSEEQTPGSYEYDFNATAFSSGVYLYKLETDQFSDVKKMVLMK